MDFAIDAGLAHAPGDQLRDLRAEVDDEDEVMVHGAHVAEERGWRNRRVGDPHRPPLGPPPAVCKARAGVDVRRARETALPRFPQPGRELLARKRN